MKQCNNETMKKGFTMMEILAAIFVITVGVMGVFGLIQQVISIITVSSSRLVATYLAQEGIEIVRNIRDSNWLEQRSIPERDWDHELGEGEWQAAYNSEKIKPYESGGDFLNISGGFYSYSSGTPTKFKRKIRIFDKVDLDGEPGDDKMKVSVEVSWQERGRSHQVTAQENVYRWY